MNTELGHLGDGVYLSFDGYQYWLAVNHHMNKVVALEPAVMKRLENAIQTHQKSVPRQEDNHEGQ